MRKLILLSFLLGLILLGKAESNLINSSSANDAQAPFVFDQHKVTFGGNIGAQFGRYTMINIAPQIGYNFTNYLNAGAGVSYSYYRYKYTGNTDKSHYAGFNLYGRLYLLDYIVVHAQPEINYMTRTINYHASSMPEDKIEKAVPSLLVGAGIRMGPVVAMLQYDLVQDAYSPYGTRIFYSVGFSF